MNGVMMNIDCEFSSGSIFVSDDGLKQMTPTLPTVNIRESHLECKLAVQSKCGTRFKKRGKNSSVLYVRLKGLANDRSSVCSHVRVHI